MAKNGSETGRKGKEGIKTVGLPDTTHLSTQLLKHDRDLGPVMCNDVCPRSVGDVFGSVPSLVQGPGASNECPSRHLVAAL